MITNASQMDEHNTKKLVAYTRVMNVLGPPMRLTMVDIECGAKKLYSQEEVVCKSGHENIPTRR